MVISPPAISYRTTLPPSDRTGRPAYRRLGVRPAEGMAEHHFALALEAFIRIVRLATAAFGNARLAAGRFFDACSFLIKALISLRSSAVSVPPAMTRSTSSGSSLWRMSVRLEVVVDQCS